MFPIKNTVPSRYPAVVTWLLIAVNCACFFYEQSLSEGELNSLILSFALVPARYTEAAGLTPADYLPFLTMMFLHAGWLHLILNMWSLWLFGPTVEDRLGIGNILRFTWLAASSPALRS